MLFRSMLHRFRQIRHRAAIVLLGFLLAAGCATATTTDACCTSVQNAAISAAGVGYVGVLTFGGGSLVITGGDKDSVAVQYAVNAPNQTALFLNPVEMIDKQDTVFVAIRPKPGTTIDLHVQMPERVVLDLRDEARDVIVRNVENRVQVALHQGGSLDFGDVEGPLTILDGGGPIKIHDVRGPIVIRDEGGPILIHEVKDSVKIDSRKGDVTLEGVEADVTVSAGPGNLTVRGVTGKLSYRKTGAGNVTIEDVKGGVEKL